MKRWFCRLLALALAALGAAALAEGDVLLGDGDGLYVEGMFAYDGGLCVYGNELYLYHPGDADFETYWFDFDLDALSGEDGAWASRGYVFADGGALRATAFLTRYGANYGAQIVSAWIGDVALTDDGRAVLENAVEFEWPDELTERYDGGSESPVTPRGTLFALDGTLYINTYSGAFALDLDAMQARRIEAGGDFEILALMPYTDGRALLFGYGAQSGYAMYAWSPETGAAESVGAIAPEWSEAALTGFAADPDTGAAYCVCEGQIRAFDPATGQLGDSMGDMPLTAYGSNAACVFGGRYYAFESNGKIFVRDLSRTAQTSVQLKVYDGLSADFLPEAYFDFTAAHPEVSVAVSREYFAVGNWLLDDILSRSSDCDVYIISTASPEYEALRERGFLYGLSGNEEIAAAFEGMYPAVASWLSSGGEPAAVPLSAQIDAFGVSVDALERIGLSPQDVPDNWLDFLDFLNELPRYMAEDPNVMAFDPSTSQQDAREFLLGRILEDYQNYAANALDASFDAPLMREILEKLERVDFAALGLPEEVVGDSFSWNGDEVLFTNYVGVAFGDYYDASSERALLMAMGPDEPAFVGMEIWAAFVNPYSEHADLAAEYLAALYRCVPEMEKYNFYPDRNDPIPQEGAEEALAEAQAQLARAQADYEAAEAADKQALLAEVEQARGWLQSVEANQWLVGPEQIEQFRARDEFLCAEGASWFVDESAELTAQYADGRISAEQYLRQLENKVRMRLMEGM